MWLAISSLNGWSEWITQWRTTTSDINKRNYSGKSNRILMKVMHAEQKAWINVTKSKNEFVISRIFGGNSGFQEKQNKESPDHRITGSPDHRITGSPDHRITGSPDHRITGSVQNKSNKLNKLIGVIDCSPTWLSQDLPYAKAKIRENTKYWKSYTTLWKCQWHNEVSAITYRLLGLLFKTDSYRAGLLVHMLYSHEIYKLSGFLEKTR